MNLKKVIFIRHGLVNNPRGVLYGRLPGFDLSGKGKAQVKSLANRLEQNNFQIERIYSSPLERTLQTSEIIGNILNIKVETSTDLLEVGVDFLAGKTKFQLAKVFLRHGTNIYGEYYTQNGVEFSTMILKRMRGFLEGKLRSTWRNFAIISHGDPLMILLWSYLNPGKDIPTAYKISRNTNYLKKGSALILDFSDAGKFIGSRKFK